MKLSQYIRKAAAGWIRVRGFFPTAKPLFHGTNGPRSTQIMRHGFRSDTTSRDHNQPAQVGVSTSRNLDFMLKGHFGNYIFVLDEPDVKVRWHTRPVQYPGVKDEFETRILAKRISPDYIRGLIINGRLQRYEQNELVRAHFPVVYRKSNKWTLLAPEE